MKPLRGFFDLEVLDLVDFESLRAEDLP